MLRWLLLGFVAAGCADQPTQTLVRFEADPALEARAEVLRVRLFREDGEAFYDERAVLNGDLAARRVPVLPLNGDATRRFRVVAELLEEERSIALVRAETGFVAGELREIALRFDEACEGVVCGDRESCRAGSCGGACVDPAPRGTPTPAFRCTEVDAGVDGGSDAALPDAGVDAFDAAPDCMCECAGDLCTAEGCRPARPVVNVQLGRTHACAIDEDGGLWCWGDNDDGQIGIGLPAPGAPSTVPEPVPVTEGFGGVEVTEITLGQRITGALLLDGRLFTWGDDEHRRLGQGPCCGDRGRFDIPNHFDDARDSRWLTASYGRDFGCAIVQGDERPSCWGRNHRGQAAVDPAEREQISEPRRINLGDAWFALSAGTRHVCGIQSLDGGALFCWGSHDDDVLGIPSQTTDTFRPARVNAGDHRWRSVAAGDSHTCGINDASELLCWGTGDLGQLGLGARNTAATPSVVGADTELAMGWTQVATSESHTCGIRENKLYCWGSNLANALGVEDAPVTQRTPLEVGDGFRQVAAGDDFACAVDALGGLFCWGRDDLDRLGVAGSGPQATPTRVCFP
ncbi:MAG: hypothetical protein AAGE52_19260 [Myxococcota bacterium]